MLEKRFQYQRLVLGYHGCDRNVAAEVLAHKQGLIRSENTYDWLGHGIYFWEHGPQRAWEWAERMQHRGSIDQPAVLGAVIHLGNCFDLLDINFTQLLSHAYPSFQSNLQRTGQQMPTNAPASELDPDRLLRRRDCAVFNWLLDQVESDNALDSFDTVRGVFQEGTPAFEDSGIRLKSHIQIAVRNPSCVVGYFQPN